MFRGISTVSLDTKGRLAIPSRYRERLAVDCENHLVLTLNPLDSSLWLYPMPEWDLIVLTAVNCADTGGSQAGARAQEYLMKLAGFAE